MHRLSNEAGSGGACIADGSGGGGRVGECRSIMADVQHVVVNLGITATRPMGRPRLQAEKAESHSRLSHAIAPSTPSYI